MNKRFTLLLLFLALTIGCATAQVTLIPKAGVSFTSYKMQYGFLKDVHEYRETGLTAGVALNLPFAKTPWLSLQPELNYLQERYTYESRFFFTSPFYFDSVVPKNTQMLHYAEVPVLIKASISKGKWLGFLNAGPALRYAVKGSSAYESNKENYTFESMNRFEASIQAGAGIGLQLMSGTLLLDARFSKGLTNINREYTFQFPEITRNDEIIYHSIHMPADKKSAVLSVMLGYAIPINKE